MFLSEGIFLESVDIFTGFHPFNECWRVKLGIDFGFSNSFWCYKAGGNWRINCDYKSPHRDRSTRMHVFHTIRPQCPATQSSGRLLGQCWEGPPDSPLWKNPGRTGAWRGRPPGSQYERSFLHPSLTSQEHHRSLWVGTPAPPRCWWSLSPCLLGTDPHHLSRRGNTGGQTCEMCWCVLLR